MPAPELNPDCNCSVLRAASRHITQLYDRALAETGLRTSQYSILARLRKLGPSTINALAAELAMDRTTLGRNILPLQREKLVSIAPSKEDKRSKRLELTAAGRTRLGAAEKRWTVAQAQFEDAFGRKRSAKVRGLLRELMGVELGGAALGMASDDR